MFLGNCSEPRNIPTNQTQRCYCCDPDYLRLALKQSSTSCFYWFLHLHRLVYSQRPILVFLLFWCWYQKSHCLWCLLWSVLIHHHPLQWNIYILSADLILTGFYGSVCSRDIRPLCRDLTLWTWRLSRKFVEKPAVQHSVFPCLHSFSVVLNELCRFLPAFCLKAHCLIPFFSYEAASSKRQRALVSVF